MQRYLKQHYGLDVRVPADPAVRNELHRIVQKELGLGVFKPETKRYVLQQIEALRQAGAEGIILGCTEFPLIIQQSDLAIPAFDTTRLHALLAVDFALRRHTPAAGAAGP